ncbi:MAG TPA: hypothetical protein VHA53_00260, partial [Nitrolancea sp.]|nr:hypothetical protein [Nitrolancea sp.]
RSGIGRVGTLPVGCEETELCIRIRQRFPEATLLYEPRARIFHQVPSQRSTWGYYLRRCYAEGRSKTMVAQHVGMADGLASERQYTMRTLPIGVLRGLGDIVRHADPHGPARAAAIVAGLATTTTGFVVSQIADARIGPTRRRAARGPLTERADERPRQIGVAAHDGPSVAPLEDR